MGNKLSTGIFGLKMTVFWDDVPCCLVEIDRRFRGTYCFHHQEKKVKYLSGLQSWRWRKYYHCLCFGFYKSSVRSFLNFVHITTFRRIGLPSCSGRKKATYCVSSGRPSYFGYRIQQSSVVPAPSYGPRVPKSSIFCKLIVVFP
jgi:hypothetical protein